MTLIKLECCNNEPAFICTGLNTLQNPAVLEDTSTSTYKDVINILSYLSGITVPHPVVMPWLLVTKTYNSQPPGFCNIHCQCYWYQNHGGQHTQLIANHISASSSSKVSQDNECVPRVALLLYEVEFDVEQHPLISFSHLGRRHQAQSMLQPHSHYLLSTRAISTKNGSSWLEIPTATPLGLAPLLLLDQ